MVRSFRLGLKYVTGLREEVGRRIEAERTRAPFVSLADFTARTAPNRRELDVLAYSGSFACFGFSRREALWQAAAVERDPKSLLAGIEPKRNATSPLPGMTPLDETRADYSTMGLTAGPHLMAHLRERLTARGVLSAVETSENRQWRVGKNRRTGYRAAASRHREGILLSDARR